MFLRIEPAAPVPIYRQIMDQVRMAVAAGRLRPDEQVPSVRDLSLELGINVQIVVKAYAELVREGTLEVRRGEGTFVPLKPRPRGGAPMRDSIRVQAAALCRLAAAAGWSREELVAFLNRLWTEETRHG
jgi:GntR family transcriptional regulator